MQACKEASWEGAGDSAGEEVDRNGTDWKCREQMEERALLFFPFEKLGGVSEYSSH